MRSVAKEPGRVAFDWIVGGIRDIPVFFTKPIRNIYSSESRFVKADLIAALNVAIVLVPQSIAYALIAGLPPHVGIYAAVGSSIVASLWGSSRHLQTGPTNAVSLLVFYTLSDIRDGGYDVVIAAGLLAVLVGVIQVAVGLAHMGVLVNFVSDSVITGFTAGAAILIAVSQLPHLLGVETSGMISIYSTLSDLGSFANLIHVPSLLLGVGTLVIMICLLIYRPGVPVAFVGMIVSALAVVLFRLDEAGLVILGEMTGHIPKLVKLPLFDLDLIGRLSTGALAVAAIGLVEAISISRAVSAETGQRIDSNQEFVGQGLSNIVSGLFSGYACSGSFTRTVVNKVSGGQSSLVGVYVSIMVLFVLLVFGSFAGYLPRTGLACVLLITAWRMVNRVEIWKIVRSSNGDTIIMVVTFLSTLLLPLEFAVLAGVIVSFAQYLVQSATPMVWPVVPDNQFRYFVPEETNSVCPQLGMLAIEGSLYFGAVHHVENAIRINSERHPDQYLLLLRLHLVDKCDVSGIHMLESVVRRYRDRGGDVYIVGARPQVVKIIEDTDFIHYLGKDHLLSRHEAVSYLFHYVINHNICEQYCNVRVFAECQPIPKNAVDSNEALELGKRHVVVEYCSPDELKDLLEDNDMGEGIRVIDVRELDEYNRIHLPDVESIPLQRFLVEMEMFDKEGNYCIVCRTGRRSVRIAEVMRKKGFSRVKVLSGGLLNWESSGYQVVFEHSR